MGPVDLAFAGATVLSELVVTLWLLLAADRPRGSGHQTVSPPH
jgi:hypothetical protein